ncbi:hypothetical protein GT354_27340 [Streptomyces sp. SID3343]|nr:hypothetical protein [Streptomyces sp. SID3343]
MNQARAFAHTHKHSEQTAPPVVDEPTPRAVAVLRVVILCLLIVPLPARVLAAGRHSTAEQALFAVLLLAFVALYVRNCVPADGGRPRWWPWTLAAQVALAYVPLVVFDFRTWSVGLYLTGLALVFVRGPWRWLVAAAFSGQDLFFGEWSTTTLDAVYNIVWVVERAVLVYGLVRMAEFARELIRVRAELIATHVARERLRFGRDLHDLLGFSLSALVLKSQLALRLVERDPELAHAQFVEGLVMARQALTDVDTVAGGYRGMSLAVEAPTAHGILSAAGVAVELTVDVGVLPADADTVLATVLREGTTNVLRHSSARRCSITAFVEADGGVVLTLANDGLRFRPASDVGSGSGSGPGMGLTSLLGRLAALGGTLTAEAVGGEFHLCARIPGRRADDPVPLSDAGSAARAHEPGSSA